MDQVINDITDGKVVSRYTGPSADEICPHCKKAVELHGVLVAPLIGSYSEDLPFKELVCPGSYIQTHRLPNKRILGYTVHKQQDFETTYVKHTVK